MKCPACHKEKSVNIGLKNNYELEKCGNCGTIFTKVSVKSEKTAEEIKDLYDHYYDFANYELPKATEFSLQKIMDSFANFRQTGNFVDIGFGEGGMLSVAEKNNWKCFGTELSPQSLKYGEKKGWTVSEDAFTDERFCNEGFDVLTMIELIEHVFNPDFFFQTAHKLLRPNGLLFLTTPNIKSINQRFLGTEWSIISPPEHVTIWSVRGLEEALSRNNFTLRKIRTEGFNPVEIIGKYNLGTVTKGDSPINRNEAAFALNNAFNSSPWRRTLKSAVNQSLSLFRLGDGIKVWAVKN